MRIASIITLTSLAISLSIGTDAHAALAQEQTTGTSMTFTGQVQGVDIGQGIVVVHGPKQGDNAPPVQAGQTSVIFVITKLFRVDQKTKISVGGQAKSFLADIKNGDPISVDFVQTTSGQLIAKSVTITRPGTKPPPPPSQHY